MDSGERLGKYQVQSILGEGGMGVVYQAYDPHLARIVAIKTIRRSLLEGKSGHDLRDRFRREARAEGRLIHPNIITIYEYQEDEQGTPFFVMEYVEGKDLKKYISRGIRFDLNKSLHIIEQVLGALAHSHKQGIVHRDIKPANIILLENDVVKIADFGIAKMDESEYTDTGIVLGTPQYTSPEQRMGRAVDARADIYSTGAVLFELITGKKAFAKDPSKKARRKMLAGIDVKIEDPKAERIFKQVVIRAMAEDADDRFDSAEEFLAAIKQSRPTPVTNSRSSLHGILIGAVCGSVALTAGYYFLSISTQSKTEPTLSLGYTPTPTTVELTENQLASVQKVLRVAKTHMLVGRLILPIGSNATESFKQALEIDPMNTDAQRGLKEIKQKLLVQIKLDMESGELAEAKNQLTLALERFPNDQELTMLKQSL